MELKRYLMILWQWWWLASIAMITTIISTIVFTYAATPTYKSQARLIVKPAVAIGNLNEQRASLSALDKPTVGNTYAEISQSPFIIQAAWDQLEIPPAQRRDFKVVRTVLQNTNIIVITTTGPNPVLAQKITSAISQETLNYVAGLYEIYDLKLLDSASFPSNPISPNKDLSIALGVVLGLALGIICAFLGNYLMTPLDNEIAKISIVDGQTGAYKSSYFLRRLSEEISRAKRVQRPFVIGMIDLKSLDETMDTLSPDSHQLLLKQIVYFLKQALPKEDLIAHWHGDTLLLLMPDCDFQAAQSTIGRLQTKLSWTAFEIGDTGFKMNITATIGLTEYNLNGIGPESLLEKAEEALREASKSLNNSLASSSLNDENASTIRVT